ncbi:unnamed protein product [Periconia digitata]|uniref:Uncharacterized protein n=1 Tax=Periconia digitata TaxID=1303443 RepID=A0A9W4UEJ5_9PLEO|nr:unnamed protein product [Periconia digitata]
MPPPLIPSHHPSNTKVSTHPRTSSTMSHVLSRISRPQSSQQHIARRLVLSHRSRFPTLLRCSRVHINASAIVTSPTKRAMSTEAAERELPQRPRRFAPLNPAKRAGSDDGGRELKGIVFDVDGTLCLPQTYMFGEMRAALGITKATDILDHIYSLPEPAQSEAQEKVRAIEREAMTKQQPQEGLVELMQYLDTRQVQKGICTRNFDAPVSHLLSTFLPSTSFDPVITRAFRPPKPSPAGILHIAATWNLEDGGDSLIMVGDSIDDMLAGRRAGAATVLLLNEVNRELEGHECTDFVVGRLDELVGVLEGGFVGR